MERVLSGDERIRKAEEIYYRRKMGLPANAHELEEPKHSYLMSKILLELLVILNLSLIIVCVQNRNFIFTQEFLEMVSNYNVNLTEGIRSLLVEDDKETINNSSLKPEHNQTSNTQSSKENVEATSRGDNQLSRSEDISDVAIPNPEPDPMQTSNTIVPNDEEVSSLNQMQLNIKEITESYSFEKPIEGTVTSAFGTRESNNKNVSGYHTGLDIAEESGTSIKSAMEGEVILVSSKGDYGKHLIIENGKLQTLYAHCSKILVNEGDKIKIGQEIARVGNTGNSTGPHLHFEIRYDGTLIDPAQILQF